MGEVTNGYEPSDEDKGIASSDNAKKLSLWQRLLNRQRPKPEPTPQVPEPTTQITVNNEIDASKEEGEKLIKRSFLVYRNNDLFNTYIPKIQALLEEQGFQVNLQVFPAGTPEEEINTWYLEHKAELELAKVLCDKTVKNSTHYKIRSSIDLDDFMASVTAEAITGTEIRLGDNLRAKELLPEKPRDMDEEKAKEWKQEYLANLGQLYVKILSSIPEEKRKNMEVVIIKGIQMGKPPFPPLIEHEPFFRRWDGDPNTDFEAYFEDLKNQTNDFADKMKSWFYSSGITNVSLVSTGAEIPPEVILKVESGQAYIVCDSHTFSPGRKGTGQFWGENQGNYDAGTLRTPVSCFLADVEENIGMVGEPEAVEKALKRQLLEALT